jgi:hypothetical protein
MTQLQITITEQSLSVDRMYRDDATDSEKMLMDSIYLLIKAVLEQSGLKVDVIGEEQES